MHEFKCQYPLSNVNFHRHFLEIGCVLKQSIDYLVVKGSFLVDILKIGIIYIFCARLFYFHSVTFYVIVIVWNESCHLVICILSSSIFAHLILKAAIVFGSSFYCELSWNAEWILGQFVFSFVVFGYGFHFRSFYALNFSINRLKSIKLLINS